MNICPQCERIQTECTCTLADGTPGKYWEDCKIDGCLNKRCAAIFSVWCYPHTKEINGSISNFKARLFGVN